MNQRPAPEMLALRRDRVPLVQPLHRSQSAPGRGYVINEEQPAAGPEHPGHLGDGAPVVGDGAQPQRAQHSVERCVGEGQCLGVTRPQVGLPAQAGRALARDGEHPR